MVLIKNIKPVYKGGYLMNKIVFASSLRELYNWTDRNLHRFRKIFYGSPAKSYYNNNPNIRYYALISTFRKQ